MLSTRATLPTLLGTLVFVFGAYAFFRVPARAPQAGPGADEIQTTPIPQVEREVQLVNAPAEETRALSVQVPDTPSALPEAALAALRTWLTESGFWPEELGAPTVFVLGPQAVLDFPLEGVPSLTVQQERGLLNSIRQTLAQQGFSGVVILTNGQSRPVFLEHLVVQGRLE